MASWKRRQGLLVSDVFVPLVFAAGEEAQVDWGEGRVLVNGQPRTLQFFCVRLAFSRATFVRAYARQDQVSFLDGHVRALSFFGGVPKRLAYDNLKTAVIRVGRGRERDLNPKFVELRSWYLFDTRFCNVASGPEKGHVENLVKRVQRTFLAEQYVLEPRHYLPLLRRKPGALHNGRPFQGEPFGPDFALLRRELEYRYASDGTKQFLRVLQLLTEHPEADVCAAVAQCVTLRAFHPDAIETTLRNAPLDLPPSRLDLSDHPELAHVGNGIRLAADYDVLFESQRDSDADSDSDSDAQASRRASAPGQEPLVDEPVADEPVADHRGADAAPLANLFTHTKRASRLRHRAQD